MDSGTKGYSIQDRQFWQIIVSLGGASVFVFAAMYSVQPLLPFFTEQFHVSVSFASLAVSITTISVDMEEFFLLDYQSFLLSFLFYLCH
jgi:YNFM family putative membrane transporter